MPAVHVSDQDFQEKVLQSKIPVLVDFYAQWCGPCKMAAPVLDKLSEEYEGKVLIVKLDVDTNQKTASEYGVMSIPTVIMFENGEKVEQKVGFGGEQGYVSMIQKVLE